jgi:hypothetical protein
MIVAIIIAFLWANKREKILLYLYYDPLFYVWNDAIEFKNAK